jgi:hypothetical protein
MENLSARFPQEQTGRNVRIAMRIFVEFDSGKHFSLQRVGCKRAVSLCPPRTRSEGTNLQGYTYEYTIYVYSYMNIHYM